MDRRETMPRPATVARMMAAKVTVATSGWLEKLEAALGARFRPMSATMAPVTAGGMTASRTFLPAALTPNPMSTRTRPVTRTEPACAPIPYCCEAVSGAMNAKEEPR